MASSENEFDLAISYDLERVFGSQPVLVRLYVTGTQLCHLCLTTSWGGLIMTTSLVILVSPLISLMIDEVASLKAIESSASIATSGGSVCYRRGSGEL